MPPLGSKTEVVNAAKFKVFLGADDYILATRKEFEHVAPQRRVPTGAGPVYFTMLSNDRLILEFAYTTGEVGNSVPANWDEMIKRNATTGEVPENAMSIQATDKSSVTKTHSFNCKCTRFRSWALGEGETLAAMELQIIDENISV
jgi:hypothetical protein